MVCPILYIANGTTENIQFKTQFQITQNFKITKSIIYYFNYVPLKITKSTFPRIARVRD